MNPQGVHRGRLERYIPSCRTQKRTCPFSNIEKLLVFMGAGGSAALKVALRGENALPRLYFHCHLSPRPELGGMHRVNAGGAHWWHVMPGVQTPPELAPAPASVRSLAPSKRWVALGLKKKKIK